MLLTPLWVRCGLLPQNSRRAGHACLDFNKCDARTFRVLRTFVPGFPRAERNGTESLDKQGFAAARSFASSCLPSTVAATLDDMPIVVWPRKQRRWTTCPPFHGLWAGPLGPANHLRGT